MIDAAHDAWLTEGVMSRRVLAWLIDAVLVGLLFLAIKVALIVFGVVTLGVGFVLLGLLPLVPFAYFIVFVGSGRHATPGQQAMGLVVRRDDDLLPPTMAQAIVWTLGLFVTMCAGVVWVLVALITARHRTLHDLAAGLVVTRARSLEPRTGIWTMGSDARRPGRPFA